MLDKLNERERMFVFWGAIAFLVVIFFLLGRVVAEQRGRIKANVQQARMEVERISRLKADINSLPTAKQIPDMNEFITRTTAILEKNQLNASKLQNRTETSSRTEEMLVIEVYFNGVSLKPVLNFLKEVEYESGMPVRVENLTLRKPLPQREIYDVRIFLAITRPKGK